MTSAQLWVLLCLVEVYERDGRATVRSVSAAAGRSLSTTHDALRRLRRAGWATWEPGQHGTLRPLVGSALRSAA